MRAGTRIERAVARFAKAREGNFAAMMAVTCGVLALSVGYGINTAQMALARSGLLAALDSAVTSTARDLTTGVIKEKDAPRIVQAFLLANGDRSFMNPGDITLDSLVIDPHRGTVSAQASIDVDMLFPLFGAENRQKITTQSASLYSDKKIEIAMMLDVTGSMGGQKIKDLKAAATNAVDLLLQGQDASDPRIRVSLVPYAEAVNVGKLADEAVFVERKNASELPPRIGASRKEIRDNTGSRTDNCATERKDPSLKADFSDDGPNTEREKAGDRNYRYLAKVNRDDRLGSCPGATVEPLSADAKKLKETIGKFSANGVTAGGIGIQWTYYMLSSKWRQAIQNARLGDGPADFDRKKVAKIAILMTDGQFNTAFAGVSGGDTSRQGTKARSYAEGLCGAMKNDGIEIFTIGFDLDNRSMSREEREQAKGVLRDCASPDISTIKHFYEASTGEELDAAYKEIIRNTERLYLTM